jgi:HTH-type transcriptional regulator/antitoxin HigA
VDSSFENEYRPEEVSLPGETVAEVLKECGLSQIDLAERSGLSVERLEAIGRGKAAITLEEAPRFERALGVPAEFWNNLEQNYREHLERLRGAE